MIVAEVEPLRPDPAAPLLRIHRRFPWAHDVFTPEELEERLQDLRRKFKAVIESRDHAHCWACGAVMPHGGWPSKWGFVSRPLPSYPSVTEMYCGPCFRKWGWPA